MLELAGQHAGPGVRNDLPEFNVDHVATATAVHEALQAEGKQTQLHTLDPCGDNGHGLFQEVRPEYWSLIEQLLANEL